MPTLDSTLKAPQTTRPVIFSAPMVRGILEDRKTQTRRIVTGQNVEHFNFLGGGPEVDETESDLGFGFYRDIERELDKKTPAYRYTGYLAWCGEYPEEGSVEITCPYGLVGDRLWVRESFVVDHYEYIPHGKMPKARPTFILG